MNAIGDKKRPSDNEITVRKNKLIRQDKWNSNQNRINCPQDNSKQAHAKKKNMKKFLIQFSLTWCRFKMHNFTNQLPPQLLLFFQKQLKENPDMNFTPRIEIIQTSSSKPAKFNFSLTSYKNIANKPKFKEIQSETAEKVEEFKLYLKKQIEHVQELEYDDCDNSLCKSVIQQTLEF